MARKVNMIVIAALAAVALLQSSASAATYFVGDSANWDLPSSPNTYSDWAADKNFVVGDILVFNFMASRHDVAEVTKSGYDNCNGANPISRQTASPANITLRTAGEHHYICTVPGHCNAGQKLAINVTGAPTPSPQPGDSSPSPSPTPVSTLAPRPSSPSPLPSAPTSAPPTATPPPSTAATPPTNADTVPPPPPTTTAPPPEGNGAASLRFAVLSLSAMALALLF